MIKNWKIEDFIEACINKALDIDTDLDDRDFNARLVDMLRELKERRKKFPKEEENDKQYGIVLVNSDGERVPIKSRYTAYVNANTLGVMLVSDNADILAGEKVNVFAKIVEIHPISSDDKKLGYTD